MTGSKKVSLQRRFADAGISTEGTKKDLTARLKTSKSVSVVGAIIYNGPLDYPRLAKDQKRITAGRRLGQSGISAKSCSSWKQPRDMLRKFWIDWPQSRLKPKNGGQLDCF